MAEIDLGEFMIFSKDFQIPLTKAKLTEIFKKTSLNHKSHKFEQFMSSVARIGIELNKEKSEEASERLREINKAIKKFESENKKKAQSLKNETKMVPLDSISSSNPVAVGVPSLDLSFDLIAAKLTNAPFTP
jgi:hypothetical protein